MKEREKGEDCIGRALKHRSGLKLSWPDLENSESKLGPKDKQCIILIWQLCSVTEWEQLEKDVLHHSPYGSKGTATGMFSRHTSVAAILGGIVAI